MFGAIERDYFQRLVILMQDLGIPTTGKPSKIYYYEKAIYDKLTLKRNTSTLLDLANSIEKNFNSTNQKFPWANGRTTFGDEHFALKLLLSIASLHELRNLLSNSIFIGLVASGESGKSSFAYSCFGPTVGAPLPKTRGRTTRVQAYHLGNVDIPADPNKHTYDASDSFSPQQVSLHLLDFPQMDDVWSKDRQQNVLAYRYDLLLIAVLISTLLS